MSALIRLGESVFPYLLDAAWKVTALIGMVFVLARTIGRRRLVARYSLWVYCLVGALILPLSSFVVRDRKVSILPAKRLTMLHADSGVSQLPVDGADHRREGEAPMPESPTPETPGGAAPEKDSTEPPVLIVARSDTAPGSSVGQEDAAEPSQPTGDGSGVVPEGVSAEVPERDSLSGMEVPLSESGETVTSPFPWRGIVGVMWIAGSAFFIVRLLLGLACVALVRQSCRSVSDPALLGLFEAAKKSAGVTRKARLCVGKKVTSPVAVGILRPAILLPDSLDREMPREQLRPILVHELAHVELGDYAVNILQRVAESFFFFHPFVWLISRGLRRLREEICDNWVLDRCSDGTVYARALTELAGRTLCPRTNRFVALGLFSHYARIRGRIERILSSARRPAVAFRLRTALILLAASLVIVGSLSFASLSARAPAEGQEVEAKEEPETPVIVEGVDLKKVPFMETIPRYARYELPPLAVLLMSDGRAMLPAQRIWSDTGLNLNEGQIVSVSATGQVRGCNQPPASWAFGPWGPEGTMCGETEYRDSKACALIGKIEDEGNREQFYIGKELTFKAPVGGRFYLGVADLFHMDNEAAFVAEVKVGGSRVDFNRLHESKAKAGTQSGGTESAGSQTGNPSSGGGGEIESFDLEKIPGKLLFKGSYNHRSRGGPYGTSEQWIKQDDQGAMTVVTKLRSDRYVARGDKESCLVEYKVLPEQESGYRLELAIQEGKVTFKRRMPGEEEKIFELPVPEGSLFDPNTRPDPYCATVILLRKLVPVEGESKEVTAYDIDNSGMGMATYTFRIENKGKETITVPAGTFEANHLVLTQLTTGDTWYKKRAGHVTDFWVLDNGVIVKILRHREPYEVELAVVQEISGVKQVKPRPGGPLPGEVARPVPAAPKRPWGPEQAAGAPDTDRAGDIPTAWASLRPDGCPEWLKVEFEEAVNMAEVRIRETFNPGAVSKVTAFLEDGQERVLWEGNDPTSQAPDYFVVKVDEEVVSRSVKIYLDTTRKEGWNEIDAVELVGKDASRQWASGASASSTYAEYGRPTVRPGAPAPEPVGEGYARGINGVRFMKTLPQYRRQELPPMPVLVMDDGRAMVPAQRIWSDTCVDVTEGQTIAFSADGQVRGCHAPTGDWAMGPWGPEGTLSAGTPYQGNKVCALIGKIESADKVEEFYIGKELTLKAPISGRLYLGVSDIFHIDNEGAFVVEVKIDGQRIDFRSVHPSKAAEQVEEAARRKFGERAVVAADGSGNTTSIQEAIDGVDEYGTVSIRPGAYRGHLVVSKAVTIEGAGRDRTRIETTSERPGISVQGCKNVCIKGLTVACGISLGEQSGLVLMEVQDAGLSVEECNLLWAQYGITISGDSNARVDKCLVAGIWGTGISIAQNAAATVKNCEVRNCYHRCITVRTEGEVIIENNLISGSAWHGVRYDHCSPTITENVFNNHARFGIYGSGSGEAKIISNLFLRNGMSGLSTWFRTNPLIRNNTFARNERGGLEMDVLSQPVVENNIFFGEKVAASRFVTSSSQQYKDSSPPPVLSHNLLWQNEQEGSEVSFSETALRVDPLFEDAVADNYNVRADSPCRGAGKDGADIGARLSVSVKSQYPITPEEKLIIPDSDSRDFQLWKKGMKTPPVKEAGAEVRAAPGAEEKGQVFIGLEPYVNAPLTGFHDNPGNDVTVPKGKQRLGDVTFQIGEGVVWLRGQDSQDAHRPEKVEGIKVGLKFRKLDFLHSTCFAVDDGTQIAKYIVHYEDGENAEIPIVYGLHLRDWWMHPSRPKDVSEGKIVWRGRNDYATGNWGIPICLYASAWENPHPDKLVRTIDFVSAVTQCSPFVVAMTAETAEPQPTEVAEDKAAAAEAVAPTELLIEVSSGGKLAVEGSVGTIEDINRVLQDIGQKRPGTTVIIRAHPEAPYRSVLRVLEACEKAGITNVSLQTVEDKSGAEGPFVYVGGEVNRPGRHSFSGMGEMTLYRAIVLAGGISRIGNPKKVALLTTDDEGISRRVEVNVSEIIAGRLADPSLKPNDRIFVPERFF